MNICSIILLSSLFGISFNLLSLESFIVELILFVDFLDVSYTSCICMLRLTHLRLDCYLEFFLLSLHFFSKIEITYFIFLHAASHDFPQSLSNMASFSLLLLYTCIYIHIHTNTHIHVHHLNITCFFVFDFGTDQLVLDTNSRGIIFQKTISPTFRFLSYSSS